MCVCVCVYWPLWLVLCSRVTYCMFIFINKLFLLIIEYLKGSWTAVGGVEISVIKIKLRWDAALLLSQKPNQMKPDDLSFDKHARTWRKAALRCSLALIVTQARGGSEGLWFEVNDGPRLVRLNHQGSWHVLACCPLFSLLFFVVMKVPQRSQDSSYGPASAGARQPGTEIHALLLFSKHINPKDSLGVFPVC